MDASNSGHEKMRQIFRSWDLNKDGTVSEDEFSTVLQQLGFSKDNVFRLFAAVDTNGDGRVDVEEFLNWMQTDDNDVNIIKERINTTRIFREVGRHDGASLVDKDIPAAVANITVREIEDVVELRKLRVPPKLVRRTLEALCLILDVANHPRASKPPSWAAIQKRLNDDDLIEHMKKFEVEQLRDAPILCAYLVSHYFGNSDGVGVLESGEERLTFQRVLRASHSVAALFKWCAMELAEVGAIELPNFELSYPDGEIAEDQLQNQLQPGCMKSAFEYKDEEEQAGAPKDIEASPAQDTSHGALERLPPCELVVEPQRILLLMMTGNQKEAMELATTRSKDGPCTKCDGAHHQSECPHFSGSREEWESWATRKGVLTKGGKANASDEHSGSSGAVVSGRIVAQPGDGSCLFHSLAYNMKRLDIGGGSVGYRGPRLRLAVAKYLEEHADETVAGSTFRDYILWDRGMTIEEYVKAMADSNIWGGAVEIAAFIRLQNLNVHIYDPIQPNEFRRVLAFEQDSAWQNCTIVWTGKFHYDAIYVDP